MFPGDMPSEPPASPAVHPSGRPPSPRLCLGLAILWGFLAAGCATSNRPPDGTARALNDIPEIPSGFARADQAILAAFFSAYGIRLTDGQMEEITPSFSPGGFMDRNALRRIARKHRHTVVVILADDHYLWKELEIQRPLLIRLPRSATYSTDPSSLRIPLRWDRENRYIEMLDGHGEIHSLSDKDFFARRAPLKHAALCLVPSGPFGPPKPTRDQRLLLADFWPHLGFYNRTQVQHLSIQETPSRHTPVETLVETGNQQIRRGRYQQAITTFQQALDASPDDPQILNSLAFAMLQGQAELLPALQHAVKASQLDPHNPVILETLGAINLRLGDGPAAVRYLERAWAYARNRPPDMQIAIMDQLTRAWLTCHREDRAWQVADHRRHAFPDYRFPKDLLQYFPALRRAPDPKP